MSRKILRLAPLTLILITGLLTTTAAALVYWYSQPITKNISVTGNINAATLRFENYGDYEYSVAADNFYAHTDCRNNAFLLTINSENIPEQRYNTVLTLTVTITETTSNLDVTEEYKETIVPYLSYLEYATNSLGDVRSIYGWDLAGNSIVTSANASYQYCLFQSDAGWFNFSDINALSHVDWNVQQVVNSSRIMFDGSNLPISENMTSRNINNSNALFICLDIHSLDWEMGDYSISVVTSLEAVAKT